VKDNLFGPRTHIEVAKGSVAQNIAYCSKTRDIDVNPNEVVHAFGDVPKDYGDSGIGQAAKVRYERAWNLAKSGDFEEIDADLLIKHYTTLKRIGHDAKLESQGLVDTDSKHEWYYGPSGTGKSYTARSENPDAYLKMCNKWWDGYQGEDVVLIEDFDINHRVLCHHLKIWADRYPFLCEIKTASTKARPKKIIVTSNYHPRDIWTEKTDLDPILRRFQMVHFANEDFRPPVPSTLATSTSAPASPMNSGGN